MTLIQKIPPTMRFMKMIANCRIFVFRDTLKIYVICVMQIMSAIQPDTFFTVSLNTKIRQLAIIFMKRMVGRTF